MRIAGVASNVVGERVLLAPSASLDYDAVPQTYRDLEIDLCGRFSFAGNTSLIGVRFNGDASALYDWQLGGMSNNANITPVRAVAATSAAAGQLPGSTATADKFGISSLIIHNYASSVMQKSFSWRGQSFVSDALTGLLTLVGSGLWRSTAPITRVTLIDLSNGSNFITGSEATLRGKGRAPLV